MSLCHDAINNQSSDQVTSDCDSESRSDTSSSTSDNEANSSGDDSETFNIRLGSDIIAPGDFIGNNEECYLIQSITSETLTVTPITNVGNNMFP